MPEPPQLTPFYAEDADARLPHLISEAEPCHLSKETYLCHSYPQSHSFRHYPNLMTIIESCNKKTSKLSNCLAVQLPYHNIRASAPSLLLMKPQSARPSLASSYHHS